MLERRRAELEADVAREVRGITLEKLLTDPALAWAVGQPIAPSEDPYAEEWRHELRQDGEQAAADEAERIEREQERCG